MNPLVSIIINNYNYGRFIRDAIESALAQDYAQVEVIVVDDGSTDVSANVIKEYENKVTSVFKTNGGQASAFNAGFEKSKGSIIIFLDSDDVLLPSAAKETAKKFEEIGVAKVHWHLAKMDADGNKTGEVVPRLPLADGDYLSDSVAHGPDHKGGPAQSPPTSGMAFSRSFLENVFPLQEADFKTGGNDYFLSALAPVFGKIKSIQEPQGCYRIHGGNDTLKPLDGYFQQFFRWHETACDELEKKLKEKGISVSSDKWPRNSWFHRVYQMMKDIAGIVPESESYILIDGNSLGYSDILKQRRRIPFTEANGIYNGEPAGDKEAISEIEKQRRNHVGYLVFAWMGFWYLDHYSEMHQYIRSKFPCLLENERVIVFDLQPN